MEVEPGQPTTYDLLSQTKVGAAADVVIASPWEGVDLIPADDQLAAVEVSSANDLVFRMEAAFEGLDTSAYTAVLFDCNPIGGCGRRLWPTACPRSPWRCGRRRAGVGVQPHQPAGGKDAQPGQLAAHSCGDLGHGGYLNEMTQQQQGGKPPLQIPKPPPPRKDKKRQKRKRGGR